MKNQSRMNMGGAAMGALIGAIISLTIDPFYALLGLIAGAAVGGWIFNDPKGFVLNFRKSFSDTGDYIWSLIGKPTPFVLGGLIPFMVSAAIFVPLMDLFHRTNTPESYTHPFSGALFLSFFAWALTAIMLLAIKDQAKYPMGSSEKRWGAFMKAAWKESWGMVTIVLKEIFVFFPMAIFYILYGIFFLAPCKLFKLCHNDYRTLSAIDAVIAGLIWFIWIREAHTGDLWATSLSLTIALVLGAITGKIHYEIKEKLCNIFRKPKLA